MNTRTALDSDSQDKRSKIVFSRPSMQATSSQPTKGSTASCQEGPPAACQLTHRKARSTKQLDLQNQSLSGSSLPHRGLGPEDAEYANLIGAMDNDLDRPECLSGETIQEQSCQSLQNKGTHICFSQKTVEGQKAYVILSRSLRYALILFTVLESKGKLRGKTKAQRKKEEKEKKTTVKIQGDELKDNMADNDDSSSTTTETSNPDVETNVKEVHTEITKSSSRSFCQLSLHA